MTAHTSARTGQACDPAWDAKCCRREETLEKHFEEEKIKSSLLEVQNGKTVDEVERYLAAPVVLVHWESFYALMHLRTSTKVLFSPLVGSHSIHIEIFYRIVKAGNGNRSRCYVRFLRACSGRDSSGWVYTLLYYPTFLLMLRSKHEAWRVLLVCWTSMQDSLLRLLCNGESTTNYFGVSSVAHDRQ